MSPAANLFFAVEGSRNQHIYQEGGVASYSEWTPGVKEQNNSVVGDKKRRGGGGKVGQAIKDLCLGPITKVARLKKDRVK